MKSHICILVFIIKTIYLVGQNTGCKALPLYLKNMEFSIEKTYFSTIEQNTVGIVAIMSESPGDPEAEIYKTYQHESWTLGGNLGQILTDKEGNTYTLPAPKINTLANPPEKQNIIYKIDGTTGIMEPWLNLPCKKTPNSKNPFGLMGLAYDCEKNLIYVSTIAGSDESNELGMVYKVDLINKSYSILLDSIDIFGLGLRIVQNKRYLYLGSARSHDLWILDVDEINASKQNLQKLFSIQQIGLRGDDKIKKIRFPDQNTMSLQITPFYYNLSSPSINQTNELTLKWNGTSWQINSIK